MKRKVGLLKEHGPSASHQNSCGSVVLMILIFSGKANIEGPLSYCIRINRLSSFSISYTIVP